MWLAAIGSTAGLAGALGVALTGVQTVFKLPSPQIASQAAATLPAAIADSAVAGAAAAVQVGPQSDAERANSGAARERARSIVRRISADRAQVVDAFAGPDALTGVVVEVDGARFVAWLTPGGQHLIVGALFDAEGSNLTRRQMLERGYAAPIAAADPGAADAPDAALNRGVGSAASAQPSVAPQRLALTNGQLARALVQSAGFIEGDAGPVVFAFVDMNCGFCGRLYDQSRSLVGRGSARVRWIPVAVIGLDSMARAAAVLQSPDSVRALAAMHAHALAGVSPTGELQGAILANNALLSAITSGRSVTPMLLIQRGDGSFSASAGLPESLADFVAGANQPLPAQRDERS